MRLLRLLAAGVFVSSVFAGELLSLLQLLGSLVGRWGRRSLLYLFCNSRHDSSNFPRQMFEKGGLNKWQGKAEGELQQFGP